MPSPQHYLRSALYFDKAIEVARQIGKDPSKISVRNGLVQGVLFSLGGEDLVISQEDALKLLEVFLSSDQKEEIQRQINLGIPDPEYYDALLVQAVSDRFPTFPVQE